MPNSAVKPAEAWAIDRLAAPPTEDPPQRTARPWEKALGPSAHVKRRQSLSWTTRRARVSGVGTEAHSKAPIREPWWGRGGGCCLFNPCLFPPQTSQTARPKESRGERAPKDSLGSGVSSSCHLEHSSLRPRSCREAPSLRTAPRFPGEKWEPSNVRTNPYHLANAEPGSP